MTRKLDAEGIKRLNETVRNDDSSVQGFTNAPSPPGSGNHQLLSPKSGNPQSVNMYNQPNIYNQPNLMMAPGQSAPPM